MRPGPIEVTPKEVEQEKITDIIVAGMDLATIPVREKRRKWYSIVRSRRVPSYLTDMLKLIQTETLEVHKLKDGTGALVIMKEGPVGDFDLQPR